MTKKKKYYLDDIDSIFCVDSDDKVYIYNYEKESFVLTSFGVDIMNWHEFPENKLDEYIKKFA